MTYIETLREAIKSEALTQEERTQITREILAWYNAKPDNYFPMEGVEMDEDGDPIPAAPMDWATFRL